jgi:hypothetical protein
MNHVTDEELEETEQITKLETYITLKAVVRTIENYRTEEVAAKLIKDKLVSVNGKVVKDPFYGITGAFKLRIGKTTRKCVIVPPTFHKMQLLERANQPRTLARLRSGEGLNVSFGDSNMGLSFKYHIMLPPPFAGGILIACLSGFKQRDLPLIGPTKSGYASVSECGIRGGKVSVARS